MNKDKISEKAYQLIESYDFNDLSADDKKFILSLMSENEFNEIRNTHSDLSGHFEDDIEPVERIPGIVSNRKSKFIHTLTYPVQLYKVAASIILLFSVYIGYQRAHREIETNLIAQADTLIIHKTDTVFQTIYDTVIIKEDNHSFAYQTNNKIDVNANPNEPTQLTDCREEICPDEIQAITSLTKNNSLSGDAGLKELFVFMN